MLFATRKNMDINPTVLKIPSRLFTVFTPVKAERYVAKMKPNKDKSSGEGIKFVFLSSASLIIHITSAVKIPICSMLMDVAEDKAKISNPMNMIFSEIFSIFSRILAIIPLLSKKFLCCLFR